MTLPRRDDLALGLNAALLLFALPLYVRVYADPGLPLVLRLVVVAHVLPALVLAVAGSALRGWLGEGVRTWYWSLLTAAGLLSLLRLVQLEVFATTLYGWTWWQKALVAGAVALPLLAAVLVGRRQLLQFSRQSTPVVLLVTVIFVVQFIGSYLAAASGVPAIPRRTDTVVIVIFDELGRDVLSRDGTLDRQLYPNFAGLVDDGVWAADATTNYGITCASVPSMLTGRHIAEIDCKRTSLAELSPSILSRLADEYRVTLYEEVLRDCPGQSTRFVCRGVPYFVAAYPHIAVAAHLIPPTIRPSFLSGALGGSHTPFAFAMWDDFIADLDAPGAAARAYFVHVAIPHAPYIYDENGALHGSPDEYFTAFPEDQPEVFANYRRQSRLADRMFGRLVEVLKRRGLYDRSTLLVTGDHGPWGLANAMNEISRMSPEVPIMMKSPSVRPGVSRVEYQHIDLAPTLADALDLPPLEGADGRSLLGSDTAPRTKRFILASHGANPFRERDWTTYIRDPGEEAWRPAP